VRIGLVNESNTPRQTRAERIEAWENYVWSEAGQDRLTAVVHGWLGFSTPELCEFVQVTAVRRLKGETRASDVDLEAWIERGLPETEKEQRKVLEMYLESEPGIARLKIAVQDRYGSVAREQIELAMACAWTRLRDAAAPVVDFQPEHWIASSLPDERAFRAKVFQYTQLTDKAERRKESRYGWRKLVQATGSAAVAEDFFELLYERVRIRAARRVARATSMTTEALWKEALRWAFQDVWGEMTKLREEEERRMELGGDDSGDIEGETLRPRQTPAVDFDDATLIACDTYRFLRCRLQHRLQKRKLPGRPQRQAEIASAIFHKWAREYGDAERPGWLPHETAGKEADKLLADAGMIARPLWLTPGPDLDPNTLNQRRHEFNGQVKEVLEALEREAGLR
jgi:hypothetical protein